MDIKRSDMSLLFSLDILLEECNVTKAAKRLHLSQPALSAQLNRLRQVFNDPLLVPSEMGKGMIATEKALLLKPQLHKVLKDLQFVVSSNLTFDPVKTPKHFVLAMNDSLFTMIGIGFIQKLLSHDLKNIKLSFLSVPNNNELIQRMERGEIDLYLGLHEMIPVSLHSRHLLTDQFKVALRKQHPFQKTQMTMSEYCSFNHVLVSQKGQMSSSIDDSLQSLGYTRNVALSISNYNQIPLVLADTDCVATLPESFLKRYQSLLKLYDIPFDLPQFSMAMAWHPHTHSDPAHQWLRNYLLSVI